MALPLKTAVFARSQRASFLKVVEHTKKWVKCSKKGS